MQNVIFRLRSIIILILLACSLTLFCSGRLLASDDSTDIETLASEGLGILSEYLRIDTSNPPGNEMEAVRFFARILDSEGISYRVFESAPGRGNLYARLEGGGREKPLLLVQHSDVVPAQLEKWSHPPFEGISEGDDLWGRGALDMKGLGVIHLLAFLELHRSGLPLKRDVILLVVADEETGGAFGSSWMLDNHFELFEDVGIVLAEGGTNLVQEGQLSYVGIERAQKVPLWLRLVVQGVPGHGSIPREHAPTAMLVKALSRVLAEPEPFHVEPLVSLYFDRIAPFHSDPLASVLRDIEEAAAEEDAPLEIGPYYAALLRNTVALTVLSAGEATNIVPGLAFAELDCRLLPGQDISRFLAGVTAAIDDPAVQIQTLLRGRAATSPPSPVLEDAVRQGLEKVGVEAEVGPSVLPGFTDSRLFRMRGIPAYGFSPFRTESGYALGVHGDDERISIADFRFGLELFREVVFGLVLPAAESREAEDVTDP